MSPALADDLAGGFVAFLALLLAVMLAAMIRAPGPDISPSSEEEEAGPQAAEALPVDVAARAAATMARAAALLPDMQAPGPQPHNMATAPASRRGQARHAARHFSAGTILRPKLPGWSVLGAGTQAPRHAAGHRPRS